VHGLVGVEGGEPVSGVGTRTGSNIVWEVAESAPAPELTRADGEGRGREGE